MLKRTLISALSFLSVVATTHGVNLIWNGGGATDNWSSALNWSGVSFTAGDTLQFGGSTRLTPANDLAVDTVVGGIDFTNDTFPNTSAFTLTGNRIILGGNITTAAITGGAFNAAITDQINLDMVLNATRTITLNNSADKIHNLTINGAISETGGSSGLNVLGGSRLTLAGSNTYSGPTILGGTAVVVFSHANALPGGMAAAGGTSALTISGGIVGLGASDFTRGLGTGVDQVRWTTAGGFAAFGADRVVNIGGGGSTMTWNAGGFVPTGQALLFGHSNGTDSQDSTHMVSFQNPLDLNGAVRTITVNDGNGSTNALIDVDLTGGVINGTGTGGLTKSGAGTMRLSAASTYTGQTYANGGVLLLNHANAVPGGIGTAGGTSNLRLGGGGVIGLGAGDFTRDLGTGVTQVQWTGSGGFSANGADRVVNIGGAGATMTWGAGGFVPSGSSLYLGTTSATHTVDFQNPIDLGGTTRGLEIGEAVSVPVDAIISGAISGTGGLTKNGDGTLALTSAASTYTGQTYVAINTLRATKLSDFGQASSLGAGVAGVPIMMSTQFRTGTLNYLGTGDSSDRTFMFGPSNATYANGGVIQNNGTGALTFTAATFNDAIPGVSVARTLFLGGVNAGMNTISGVIQNSSTGTGGLLNVTKQDAGTWVLSGANTYSGTTTVSAGALHINSTSAIGTGPLTLSTNSTIDNSSAGPITLTAANAVTFGSFTYGGTQDLSFANGTSLITGGRTITLGGTGRTLNLGLLTLTTATSTLAVNETGGSQLKFTGIVLSESNQARTLAIAGNADVEVTGPVTDGPGTGADNLSYTGNGSLKLSSNNSYTGTTTVNNAAGVLTLSGSSTTTLVTVSAGTLNINHASAIGSGILDINGGTINNTSGAAITVATANLVTLDANFTFGGSSDLSFVNGTASTSGGRTITLNGTSKTLAFGALSMTNTLTTTVNDAGTGNKLAFGGLVLADNNQARTQTFTGSAAIDITGAITDGTGTGADALSYTGSNVMRLMGAGSYTGTTTVNTPTGILRTTSTGSLGSAAVTVVQGTLELNNAAQTVGVITFGSTTNTLQTVAATINLGTGTTLTQTSTFIANDNVNGQAAFISGGSIDLNGTRTWTVDDSAGVDADLTVSSAIKDTGTVGTFTKNGPGRLVLSGNSTFADTFAMTDGIVRIEHANALGATTGGTTLTSGRALELSGGITFAAENLSLTGTGVSSGGALRNVSGTNVWTGTIDLAGDARINADAGTQLTVSAITAGGASRDVTFGGSGDIIASGKIGSGGSTPVDQVLKDGSGTLTLNNTNNDFTGTFTVNDGTLKLGATQVIPDAESLTVNKGTVDLNGNAETINALNLGNATTTVAGNTASIVDGATGGVLRLTNLVTYNPGSAGFENGQALISANLDLNNASRTFAVNDNVTLSEEMHVSGIISNSGATASGISKSNGGTLILSGANTYNGNTAVNAGVLRVAHNQAMGTTGTVTLANTDAVLELANGVNISRALTASDTGNNKELRLQAGATSATYSANVTLSETTAGNFDVTAGTGGRFTVSGVVGGTGAAGLSKEGAGTVVLTNTNTYSGGTSVNAGKLEVNNGSGSGTGTGTVTVASGAMLAGDGAITANSGNFVFINGTLQVGAFGATQGSDFSLTTSGAGSTDFEATSVLLMELWSTTGTDQTALLAAADMLRLFGTVDITSGATLKLDNPNAVAFQAGDMFRLFDWTGTGTRTGTFTVDGSALNLTPGLSVDTTNLYSTGTISITTTSIPEPGRTMLLMLGLAAMLRRRRA
ncbi:MAG: autotransporter-associated beta strand repeat-containing protein [Verrucomicrobiota bacterium]